MPHPTSDAILARDEPWLVRATALFFSLYAAFILWIPKLGIGAVTFYAFEPLAIVLVAILVFERRLTLRTPTEVVYLTFMLLCLAAFIHGAMRYEAELKPLLLIIKYALFGLYISCGYLIAGLVSQRRFVWIVAANSLFLLGNAAFVIWNTRGSGLTLQFLVGEWDRSTRLVGWTGMVLKFEGIEGVVLDQIQTTSVPMGVFCGLFTLLCLTLYFYDRRPIWLLGSVIAGFALQLTYSRSGLVVLGAGVALLLFEVRRRLTWLPALVLIALGLLALFAMTDAASLLGEYGTVGKLQYQANEFTAGRTESKRIEYWALAYAQIDKDPTILLFGAGFGEAILIEHVGGGTLESLMFDALFQMGLAGLGLVIAVYVSIWRTASLLFRHAREGFVRGMLAFYTFSVPGLLLTNAVGGNQLQTDFIVPLYFTMFGVCVGRAAGGVDIDVETTHAPASGTRRFARA